MFRFILHKMLKNRWLTISLLTGYMIAVAIVSSMPLYSHAILNRLLLKDLESVQTESQVYPGRVMIEQSLSVRDTDARRGSYVWLENTVNDQLLPALQVDALQKINLTGVDGLTMYDSSGSEKLSNATASLMAANGLMDHIDRVGGSLPSSEKKEGVYEAVISETASEKLGLGLGSTLTLKKTSLMGGKNASPEEIATVTITGVFREGDNTDAYWVLPSQELRKAIFIDYDLMKKDFLEAENCPVSVSNWYLALDYRQFTIENCDEVLDAVEYYGSARNFSPSFQAAFTNTLTEYRERRATLTSTLWIIEIPILLMLLFYIFMVTGLILGAEKNEIAVLRSRGTSGGQILVLYLIESAVLAGISFAVGPLFGMLFCKMVGASDGFMSFVNRRGLNVALTAKGWGYAAVTAVVLVATMAVSVLLSRDTSIVALKRKKSRASRPFWQKFYLDFVMLAVALYGLYSYNNRLKAMETLSPTSGSDMPVDFLLYGASTLFILSLSLIFLRLLPLIVRLIYKVGEKRWGPVLYLTLSQISRGGAGKLTISLFLIFTLSMGVFNAVTVRTLDRNQEDRVEYMTGADIVLQEEWPSTGGGATDMASAMDPTAQSQQDNEVYYSEPQFSRYQKLSTVSAAARVLTLKDRNVTANSSKAGGVTIMGIVPDEFGALCWYRSDLAPYHINEYLNLLADEPRAVLMSSGLMEKLSISTGDTAYLALPGNTGGVQVVVYAAIDYFPTYNPKSYSGKDPVNLVVCNLTYLQQEMKMMPYKVWMKKADGATSADVYEELTQAGISITSLTDTTAELVDLKNDAVNQGVNGFFTLSFIVTMMITCIGFFIYWILAIGSRKLQFGILRSMGMSRTGVMMVLMWEQILLYLSAAAAEIGLGTLAALLYAPFLECGVTPSEQILPFIVVGSRSDYLRIILIVAIMLAAAAVILSQTVNRLKAGEALKLGED